MFIYIIYYPVILFCSEIFFNKIFTEEEINHTLENVIKN